jgi:hypothetical protein
MDDYNFDTATTANYQYAAQAQEAEYNPRLYVGGTGQAGLGVLNQPTRCDELRHFWECKHEVACECGQMVRKAAKVDACL